MKRGFRLENNRFYPKKRVTFAVVKTLIILFLSLLSVFSAGSQTPYYQPLNRANGLPSDIVFDVFQDSKGLIWLATNEGIYAYDGNHFKPYTAGDQSSKSGTDIKEDRLGRIWYQNFDGHLFYIQDDIMKQLEPRDGQAFYHYALLKEKLVMSYMGEVVIYDLKTLEVIETIVCERDAAYVTFSQGDSFHVVTSTENETLEYIVSDAPSFVKRRSSSKLTDYQALVIEDCVDKIVGVSKFGPDQTVFVKNDGGMQALFKTQQARFYQNINVIEGKYYLCSTGGLFVYDEKGVLENNKPYFPGSSVSGIFKDKWGNYWVSTLHEGVFIVRDFGSAFISTKGNKANRITVFQNQLLVGMKNGELYTMDSTQLKEMVYKSPNDHGIYFLDGLVSDEHLFLTGSGFTVLDKNFSPIFPTTPSLKDIEKIDNGVYATAVSGFSGLMMLDEQAASIWNNLFDQERIKGVSIFSSVLPSRGRSVAYSAKDTTIYFATNIGLYLCTPTKIEPYLEEGKPVYAEQVDVLKNYLFIRNAEGEITFKRTDRLADDIPLKPFEGKGWRKMKKFGETLVVMSDTRFMSIEMLGGNVIFKELLSKDPLDQINDFLLVDRVLYIASDNGVFIVNLDDLPANEKPEFIFHSCKVNGQKVELTHLKNLKQGETFIEINYSFLQFPGVEEQQLEYTLDGENWRPLTNNNGQIAIDNLASGSYKFMVRTGQRVMIDQQIEIPYPIWQRAWFVSLAIALIALLIYLYFKNRTNILLRQNILLQEKVDLEKDLQTMMMKSIKSQMNPHFFYNALNTIQSFIFTDDKKNAGIYLSKFSKLTRLILEMSDQESVSLYEELNALRLYLDIEMVRFRDDFSFNIEIDENIDIDEVYLPSMLVQPYVENAIRHGLLHKRGQKLVFIGFYKRDTNLEIVVEDNGVGREKSRELNSAKNRGHQSFASAANSRRVEILNKMQGNPGVSFVDKKDKDGHAEGTIVKITIPLSNT